jgi:predicted RNA-binding Zn-ribbon protein involved in translation (DUF1610 family)/predicted PolB exonuclease-like 3'-5' exonuclease
MSKPQVQTVRRLFWDIETSPNVVLTWRTGYKINIDHENILKERAIICVCYKWEGEKQVHSLTWDASQDDKAMLQAFLEVANSADEMVAHNGDRFDIAWFRTRCLFHGLQPLPDYKTVDTLAWARRLFYFNSNRLDYIARFLGLGGKLKTSFGLWKDIVLRKDAPALQKMVTYCKRDVALLEQVWKRLRSYSRPKTHAAVLSSGAVWACPHCGSTNVRKTKTRVTASGAVQHQMRCSDCGSYYTISDRAHKQYLKRK